MRRGCAPPGRMRDGVPLMFALVVRRLISLIPILLIVSFIVFMLTELVPGDAATTIAGGADATPERVEEVRRQLGLDRPVFERYGDWLADAVRLDFGSSLLNQQGPTISEEIADRIPVTFSIAIAGLLVSMLIGIPLGILSGLRPGAAIDRASVTGTSLGLAIPSFVLALFLINAFAIERDWFPALGYTPFDEDPWEWLRSITLPALAIGLFSGASVARQVRAAIIDALQSNYVRTALSVGMPTRTTVVKYAFKNAAIPAVTVLGLQLSALLGGVVIIEQIFSIPGIGQYLLGAIVSADIPAIQGCVLVLAVIAIAMSLIVDILYALLNPKIRVAA
jgi:peptide/nickel transport system permease protein